MARAGANMLVVDDEPAIARSLSLLFTRRGHRVLVAQGGNAALDLMAQTEFDCVVLDYRLPDIRGDALYAYMVARQPNLRGRVIFLTGDIVPDVRDLLDRTGCRVVTKPFELAELVAIVDEVLAEPDPHSRDKRNPEYDERAG
jgi:DNA-binding response OmpR family regulator